MADDRRFRFPLQVAGGLVTAGAVAAIADWLSGWPQLTRTAPDSVPPEVAFGLALAGVGVVLSMTAGGWQRAAAPLGAAITLLASTVLVASRLGIDAGLRHLLPAAASLVDARLPLLAPNALLGLALAGAALAVGRRVPMLRCALGACCAALGASALLGYATGVHYAYGWGASREMAPATAAGLAIAGLALGLGHGLGGDSTTVRHWRGPLLAGLSSAVATLLFSQALSLHQDRQLRLTIEAGASRLRDEVRTRLQERMDALDLLASIWRGRLFPSREAWEADAELVMSQSPGLEAIEWIEPGGAVAWIHPADVVLQPPDPHSLEAQHDAAHAIALGPVTLPSGRPGLRVLAPLRVTHSDPGWVSSLVGDWDGWLAGVFDTQKLLSDLVAPMSPSYVIRMAFQGKIFFETAGARWDPRSRWIEERAVALPGGLRLMAWVEPSRELLDARRSELVPVLLAGGLLMSTLLAVALGLANVARARAVRLEGEIGERRRAEAEVRRLNQDLEDRVHRRTRDLSRSNEDLRRFAAFLSHELRQPVAAQDVWAELLETQCRDRLDDRGKRYLAQIRAFSTRIAEAIDAQLSLFAAAGTPLTLARVDASALIEGLLAEMKDHLESHRADVRVAELPVLRADARLLRQLFRNLIENALNYRRPDVPLVVRVYSGVPQPGSQTVEIVVEDNGRGFSAAEAERIFEPGGRVDPEREGSGLGLTVCRRIAERHGGRLEGEGLPGVGAVFRLVLPRPADGADEPETPGGSPG